MEKKVVVNQAGGHCSYGCGQGHVHGHDASCHCHSCQEEAAPAADGAEGGPVESRGQMKSDPGGETDPDGEPHRPDGTGNGETGGGEPACGCGHSHGHDHGEGCGCGHDHAEGLSWKGLIVGSALFAAGFLLNLLGGENYHFVSLGIFIVSYLVLGWEVLLTAAKNIAGGAVFDENFLMAIATIGAFAIGEYPEAVAVMLFFQLGEYFEHRAVERSRASILKAINLRPDSVILFENGAERQIQPEEVRVGDELVLRPGDRIALDGEILSGESSVDTSPVTGEPVPVHVRAGDSLLSGGINLSGVLHMRVAKPLSESTATRIMDAVENAAANKPRIDRFITRFARVYTPVVCVLALLLAVGAPLLGLGEWKDWIYRALVFLMASCPCAIVLSVPLAFFAGIGNGSSKGILFKGGASLEALAKARAVVLDKTGTLTKGEFALARIIPEGDVQEDWLLTLAADAERLSTHPVAQSLRQAAAQRGLPEGHPLEVREIAGKGVTATLEQGRVSAGSAGLMATLGIQAPQGQGTVVYLALDGRYLGRLEIEDGIKRDAREGVAALRSMGLHTAMLTGDAEDAARRVSETVGLDEYHARLLPDEKLQKLEQIRSRSGAVMFVGDGINDAPVLAGADVGAAMGSGADAAIEAADVVFMNTNVSSVAQAVQVARRTQHIAMQNTVFAIIVKMAVLALGFAGLASLWWAVLADVGVALLCVVNALRLMKSKK